MSTSRPYGLPVPKEFNSWRDLSHAEFFRHYDGIVNQEILGDKERVFFTESRGAVQAFAELKVMVDMFRQLDPSYVLEIGQYYGGTLWYWMNEARSDAVIVGVDIDHSRLQPYVNRDKVVLIEGDSSSEETLLAVKRAVPHLDFLFIDGDHKYSSVLKDYTMYEPLVRRGGVIIMHDVHKRHYNEVRLVWMRVRNQHQWYEYIADRAESIYGIGIIIKGD